MNDIVVTVLGHTITAELQSDVSAILKDAGLTVATAEHLSAPPRLPQFKSARFACVRLTTAGTLTDVSRLRTAFLHLSESAGIDIALESETTYGRERRLIALDMDSTLIGVEVIDELARLAGVGVLVSRITESAMRGEIDFKQSFTKRLSLLRGLTETQVRELLDSIPLTSGAENLVAGVKQLGFRTAILSGGFTFVGRYLQARLGIDHLFANELEIVDGHVTGKVHNPIVDGQRKMELLQKTAELDGVPLDQVVAVGDGANDLPMINLAGMGIAFHAKPVVRQSAPFAISSLGLDAILYLL